MDSRSSSIIPCTPTDATRSAHTPNTHFCAKFGKRENWVVDLTSCATKESSVSDGPDKLKMLDESAGQSSASVAAVTRKAVASE